MDEKTKTALIFGATIIMQEVCGNSKLSKAQRDKMRKYAPYERRKGRYENK
jgi:hypothetical protein